MVNQAASQDGGGSGGLAPFEKHPASPDEVRGQATALGKAADQVIDERATTQHAFDPAAQNWAGVAAPELLRLPVDALNTAEQVGSKLAWSAVPLNYWANEVEQFNSTVDAIVARLTAAAGSDGHYGATGDDGKPPTDQQVADKRNAAESDAKHRYYTALEQYISQGSADTAAMYRDGPTPDNVRKALEVNALPSTEGAFSIFSITWLVETAKQAAQDLRDAMDGKIPADRADKALQELMEITSRLAERGGTDPEALRDQAFLKEIYNDLGTRLIDLPNWLRSRSDLTDSDRNADLAALGAGILELSSDKYGGSWDNVPQAIRDAVNDLPRIVDTGVYTQVGEDAHAGHPVWTVQGGNGLLALAEMLGCTAKDPQYQGLQGGKELSGAITHSVANLAGMMDQTDIARAANDPTHSGEDYSQYAAQRGALNDAMQNLLGVSTRNTAANAEFLEDKDAATDLKHLYDYNWGDQGKAVAGLTDWIGRDADAAHQQGTEDVEANKAAEALIRIVTGDRVGADRDGAYNADMFKQIKDNPWISRSFANVAGSYLDELSTKPQDATGVLDSNHRLEISGGDRERFLSLIARDKDAMNALSTAAGAYEQRLLNDGIQHDDAAKITEAGLRTSHLDAALGAGRLSEAKADTNNHNADADAAYRENLYYANLGRSMVVGGVGLIPGAGGALAAGFDPLMAAVINHDVQPPAHQMVNDGNSVSQEGYTPLSATYNYLAAEVSTGKVDLHDPRMQEFVQQDGDGNLSLKPIDQLNNQEATHIVGVFGREPGIDTYIGPNGYDPQRDYNSLKGEGDNPYRDA